MREKSVIIFLPLYLINYHFVTRNCPAKTIWFTIFHLFIKKEKSDVCDTCNVLFSSKWHLKRHIKTVHEKEKPFNCLACDKFFSQKHLLNRHIETFHEESKSYECSICSNSFSRQDYLKKHMDSHLKKHIKQE